MNYRVGEIEILLIPVNTRFAGFHGTIHHPLHINGPECSQILLNNNIIIKKEYLIQLWIQLWDG